MHESPPSGRDRSDSHLVQNGVSHAPDVQVEHQNDTFHDATSGWVNLLLVRRVY